MQQSVHRVRYLSLHADSCNWNLHQEHHHIDIQIISNPTIRQGIMFKNSIEDRSGSTAPVPGPIKGARLAV